MIRDQVEPGATRARPRLRRRIAARLPPALPWRRRRLLAPDARSTRGAAIRISTSSAETWSACPISGTFDYVIASNVVGYLIDVQDLFRELARVTHPSSRVIVAYYNFAWEPVLWLAERFGLKTREPLQSWLSNDGLANLVEMADLELVKSGYRTPLPVGPAWLTRPLNNLLSAVPLVNRLGLISFVTARPRKAEVVAEDRGADVHRRRSRHGTNAGTSGMRSSASPASGATPS